MSERVRAWVRVGAVVVPIVVAALLGLVREDLANTGAALVLVLVVVAVAVSGDRLAGVLAALSAAGSFDYFLTAPFHRFAIVDRDDLETAVLLLAIGLAVVEIARWGRRQAARSSRRAGYLDGVARAATLAAEGSSSPDVADTIAAMITEVLDLDSCRFEPVCGVPDRPVLRRDGTVTWADRVVDVRREGLPGMDVVELPAGHGPDGGRFLLTASTEVRRPTREQLLVAVTLAEQLTDRPGLPASGS
jgi:K+-sensing histidine kinase KdpD